jgi:hypothetical protein
MDPSGSNSSVPARRGAVSGAGRAGTPLREFAGEETQLDDDHIRDGERGVHAGIGMVRTPTDPIATPRAGGVRIVGTSDTCIGSRWDVGTLRPEIVDAGAKPYGPTGGA